MNKAVQFKHTSALPCAPHLILHNSISSHHTGILTLNWWYAFLQGTLRSPYPHVLPPFLKEPEIFHILLAHVSCVICQECCNDCFLTLTKLLICCKVVHSWRCRCKSSDAQPHLFIHQAIRPLWPLDSCADTNRCACTRTEHGQMNSGGKEGKNRNGSYLSSLMIFYQIKWWGHTLGFLCVKEGHCCTQSIHERITLNGTRVLQGHGH